MQLWRRNFVVPRAPNAFQVEPTFVTAANFKIVLWATKIACSALHPRFCCLYYFEPGSVPAQGTKKITYYYAYYHA